ncbi:MAG: PilW family protein [Saprospiraceae bacterium]|nr:PilW family protein [Saprospiraceae bacterium]
MLAIISSTVLIAGLYQIFHSHQYNFIAQGDSIELQQNLRAGIYLLTKDIRLSRYNSGIIENVGFTSNLNSHNVFSDTQDTDINYTTDFDRIAFYTDKNGENGIELDSDPDNTDDTYDDGEEGEFIAYRLKGTSLQRFNSEKFAVDFNVANAWQTIAINVDALNFVFINNAGAPTTNHIEARSVQISLLVRSSKKDSDPDYRDRTIYKNYQGEPICNHCTNDRYRRRLIRMTVRIRNEDIRNTDT